MAWSGSSAATSVTKSPVPSVSAVCTIRWARAVSTSRRFAIALGVKPRDTMPRSLVCCGGSMLSMMSRCSPSDSSVTPCAWRMIAVFSSLEYTSLLRETSSTSACLVTTQYPSSSKPEAPRGCAFHHTGIVRRSSANSSVGIRLT